MRVMKTLIDSLMIGCVKNKVEKVHRTFEIIHYDHLIIVLRNENKLLE